MHLNHRSLAPRGARQQGASLIEILVSVLVISFGILAMAAVQSNSVKFHKATEFRATATLMAADIADRMRANNAGAGANNYAWKTAAYTALTAGGLGTTRPHDCGSVAPGNDGADGGPVTSPTFKPCTPAQMAANDLWEWQSRLLLSLPGASGHITDVNATSRAVDLWIVWRDPDETDPNATQSAECPRSGIWSTSTIAYRCMFMRVAL